MISNKLISQIKRFTIVGIFAVLIDLLFYKFFLLFSLPVISKSISFFIGSLYSYFANMLFTFKLKNNSLNQFLKFIIIYSLSLFINVWINSLVLTKLSFPSKNGIYFAFLIAVICSASFNFFCIRNYVFSKNKI